MLLRDAIGIAHQHVGPSARPAQRPLGDREVVVDQVELGVARGGEEDFAGVGDGDFAPGDREGFGAGLGLGGGLLSEAGFRGMTKEKRNRERGNRDGEKRRLSFRAEATRISMLRSLRGIVASRSPSLRSPGMTATPSPFP